MNPPDNYRRRNLKGRRVIVLGYIVRGPIGGLAWHHLQYVLGLHRLGCDVNFVEVSGDYPSCYDPSRGVTDVDPTYGLHFAQCAFSRLGLGNRWAYYDSHTTQWRGPCAEQIVDICGSAEVVVNVSGVNPLRPWFSHAPVRILVDTDPVFTQVRHLQDARARAQAALHNVFLSFGENIGKPGCSVPDDGFRWQPTRQPVVLDAWSLTPPCPQGAYTTVMQWDSYSNAEYQGRKFGMKSSAFESYVLIPERVEGAPMELAIGSESAPRQRLIEAGWRIRDPLEVTRDPWTYQRYLQRSKAEFSVAKHGYVASNSGWFSERSTGYLATGRPVVVHDTGFTQWLPPQPGVIPFSSPEEAVQAVEELNDCYDIHCQAARPLAQTYFSSDVVLERLLEYAADTARSGAEDERSSRAS